MGNNCRNSDQNTKVKHTKKHDHSFLGKHTKEEKLAYLASLEGKTNNQNGEQVKIEQDTDHYDDMISDEQF